MRFLFRINWADSGPGFSWPADYHLIWLPGFERWVLIYSADSPDAFGYSDFALGSVGAADDWRAAVREILMTDWRFQFNEWDQSPWAYLLSAGLVKEEEALDWRKEAWAGHEEFCVEEDEEEEEDQDEGEENEGEEGEAAWRSALAGGEPRDGLTVAMASESQTVSANVLDGKEPSPLVGSPDGGGWVHAGGGGALGGYGLRGGGASANLGPRRGRPLRRLESASCQPSTSGLLRKMRGG